MSEAAPGKGIEVQVFLEHDARDRPRETLGAKFCPLSLVLQSHLRIPELSWHISPPQRLSPDSLAYELPL
jgi:hypothetical protein